MCGLSGVLHSETLAKVFLVQRGKMQEAVCLQDKWLEAFPCWFSRQTADDRKKKPVLNQTALCSETPQQTEAYSG